MHSANATGAALTLDAAVFDRAIDEIASATTRLLDSLQSRGTVRTREHEREKARARWKQRESRMTPRPPFTR